MKMKCSFILKASMSLILALLMLFGTVATSFAASVNTADKAASASASAADTSAVMSSITGALTSADAPASVMSSVTASVSGVLTSADAPASVTSSVTSSVGGALTSADAPAGSVGESAGYLTPAGAKTDLADTGAQADLAEAGAQTNHNWGGTVYFRVPDQWNLTTYSTVYCVIRRSITSTASAYSTFTKMTVVGNTSYSRLYKCTLSVDHSSWNQDEYIAFSASADSTYGEWTTTANGGGGGPYTAGLDYGTNSGGYYLFYPSTATSATTTTTNNPIAGYYNATEATVMKYNTGTHYAYAYTNGSSSSTGGTTTITAYYLNGTTPTVSTNSNTPTASYSSMMQGCKVTVTATAKTNYEFGGWYSNSSLSTLVSSSTSYSYYSYNTKSLYAKFTIKPLITINQSGGTGTVKIGGTAQTTAYVASGTSTALDIVPPSGYTISSVTKSSGTDPSWTTSTTTHYAGTVAPTANTTIAVTYAEITGVVGLTAYTDGTAGTTGGTVKNTNSSGADVTQTGSIGISTTYTAYANTADGYAFAGWQFSGTNYADIRYRFSASDSWSTPSAEDTTVGSSSNTTIYLKTDGTSGLTASTAVVKAMFINDSIEIYAFTRRATGSNTTYPKDDYSNNAASGSGSYSISAGETVTLTAGSLSGCRFMGWYSSSAAVTTTIAFTSTLVSTNATYSFTATASVNQYYYALYRYIYYISVFDSYQYDYTNSAYTSTMTATPPKTVVVTRKSGSSTTQTCTYTYDATATSGYGTVKANYTGGTSVAYGEGNRLAVLTGDTVKLNYSTLASSDAITAAFFTTTGASGYTAGSNSTYMNPGFAYSTSCPYASGGTTSCFRAIAAYYSGTNAETIGSASYPSHYTLSSTDHYLQFRVIGHRYNITIDLGTKKQVVFSDTTNTVINSINADDYYAITESLSSGSTAATRLAVYAKGNANQTTTITKANVKLYYYDSTNNTFTDASGTAVSKANRVELTGDDNTVTVNISSGSTITTSTASNSSNYIYFTGTMPATDVYVELNTAVTYKMYIGSKVVSDVMANKTYLAEVATVTATPSTSGQSAKTAGTTAVYNSSYNTVNAGDTVTYTMSWSGSWDSYYMFSGWYKGTSSGPTLTSDNLLSTKTTFSYKPTANTYVYAVGTRDLFINGSKYLFGGSDHWKDQSGNTKNFMMDFDPTYSSSHGQGRYVYTISAATFAAASNTYYVGNTYLNQNVYYNDNSKMGNSFFKIFDAEANQTDLSFWSNITNYQQVNDDLTYGKIYYRDGTDQAKNGNGYIAFTTNSSYSNSEYWSMYHAGYDAPIYIYAYPDKTFSVQASYVYNNLYVSNGFNSIDKTTTDPVYIKVNSSTARSNNTTNDSGFTYYLKFNGAGWDPIDNSSKTYEGHVSHVIVGAKEATVTLSKTVASGYKVSSFVVYDLYSDTVKAYVPTASSNTYTTSLKMQMGHDLYIVPIIESTSANMKVIVDASQLDKDKWGDFVGCYAWYTNSGAQAAYGKYPGQLMIPSDDGLSLSANFPATYTSGSTTYTLSGITFSNYVDGTKTWLGCTGVMGTVTTTGSGTASSPYVKTATGGIINVYNSFSGTDSGKGTYDEMNFKCQTYDYREPVAFYANKDSNASSFLMNFALKGGNANLISWGHDDLIGNNILTFQQNHSGWDDVNFEYLTTADGDTYADMNGNAITGKPTATFYVAAKGQAIYSNSTMTRIFGSGKTYQSPSGVTYPSLGTAASANVSQNYAVQWYVYDASGAYITTMLSAGIADRTVAAGTTSLIANALSDLGYAVEGKSVAISYDNPRFCYTDSPSVNTGDSFNTYRFTGQWYSQSAYQTAKVYAKVGMMTDNGEDLVDASSASYGSATVSITTSKLSYPSYGGTGSVAGDDGTVYYGTATIADGDKQAITLNASETNFSGWYYYDANDKLILASTSASFSPTFSKDATYYAIYDAKATYSYQYTGREQARSYGVDGGELTEAEMAGTATGCSAANTVSTSRTDFTTKSPGTGIITIFKKTITWNTVTGGMLNNATPYTMLISNATISTASFTLTAYYPDTAGGSNTAHTVGTYEYNTAVDLTSVRVGSLGGSGKVFVGWYDAASGGNLLSTQWNFGQRIIKDTTIYARYATSAYSGSGSWGVFVDDQEVTHEMTTATSGRYYNDTIIRLMDGDSNTDVSLTGGQKVGIIVINDGGTGTDISAVTAANLTAYANALTTSGATGKIGSDGITATNVFTTSVTKFGRADLAVRADYATNHGNAYAVYAYFYNGSSYTWATVVTGTY